MERRGLDQAPTLITIDHHTDIDDAFRKHAFHATDGRGDEGVIEAIRVEQLAKLDRSKDASLAAAIEVLANDEHIDAADAESQRVRF